jgi:hypothetical protein
LKAVAKIKFMASLVGENEFTTSLFQFGDVVLFRDYSKNAPTLKF